MKYFNRDLVIINVDNKILLILKKLMYFCISLKEVNFDIDKILNLVLDNQLNNIRCKLENYAN